MENNFCGNLKNFFELLPKNEEEFVTPLMDCFEKFCNHPSVQDINEEQLNKERIHYSNLYRELLCVKNFIRNFSMKDS